MESENHQYKIKNNNRLKAALPGLVQKFGFWSFVVLDLTKRFMDHPVQKLNVCDNPPPSRPQQKQDDNVFGTQKPPLSPSCPEVILFLPKSDLGLGTSPPFPAKSHSVNDNSSNLAPESPAKTLAPKFPIEKREESIPAITTCDPNYGSLTILAMSTKLDVLKYVNDGMDGGLADNIDLYDCQLDSPDIAIQMFFNYAHLIDLVCLPPRLVPTTTLRSLCKDGVKNLCRLFKAFEGPLPHHWSPIPDAVFPPDTFVSLRAAFKIAREAVLNLVPLAPYVIGPSLALPDLPLNFAMSKDPTLAFNEPPVMVAPLTFTMVADVFHSRLERPHPFILSIPVVHSTPKMMFPLSFLYTPVARYLPDPVPCPRSHWSIPTLASPWSTLPPHASLGFDLFSWLAPPVPGTLHCPQRTPSGVGPPDPLTLPPPCASIPVALLSVLYLHVGPLAPIPLGPPPLFYSLGCGPPPPWLEPPPPFGHEFSGFDPPLGFDPPGCVYLFGVLCLVHPVPQLSLFFSLSLVIPQAPSRTLSIITGNPPCLNLPFKILHSPLGTSSHCVIVGLGFVMWFFLAIFAVVVIGVWWLLPPLPYDPFPALFPTLAFWRGPQLPSLLLPLFALFSRGFAP